MVLVIIYGGFFIIALLSWFVWDKRYHRNHGTDIPKGYVGTDEVFIDLVNGKKIRVFYDPQTGKRFYYES